jgi:hypothetical protein
MVGWVAQMVFSIFCEVSECNPTYLEILEWKITTLDTGIWQIYQESDYWGDQVLNCIVM